MLALSLTARAEGNKIPLAFRERGVSVRKGLEETPPGPWEVGNDC